MTSVHKLPEAIKEGRFSYTQRHSDTIDTVAIATRRIKEEELIRLIVAMQKAPKFVFDTDLINMIDGGPEKKKDPAIWPSVEAVARAGLDHLPYPELLVEWVFPQRTKSGYTVRCLVLLSERPAEEKHHTEEMYHPYIAHILRLVLRPDGDYLMLSPFTMFLAFTDNAEGKGVWGLHYACTPPKYHGDWDDKDEILKKLMERDIQDDCLTAGDALIAAVLLLNTNGIKREVIEPSAKLNKKRIASKKMPLQTYTQIRIGHVYTRTGERKEYDAKKPMRVHWRRAHTKRVHYGVGRTQTRLAMIPATLVNYIEGDEPAKPEVKVKW